MSTPERVALVTGGGRGLGRAIALRLAVGGHRVAVNDIDEGPAVEVAGEIRDGGGTAVDLVFPVDDHRAAEAAVSALVERWGRLDSVVTSAGIASSGQSIGRTPVDEFRTLLDVHFLGAVNVVRAALPHLRASGDGRVVLISTVAAAELPPNSAPYSAAKAAVEALALTLAKEERRNGITSNVIAPGLFDTRLGREIMQRVSTKSNRLLEPSDPRRVAEVVEFLLGPGATGVTGQRIRVD